MKKSPLQCLITFRNDYATPGLWRSNGYLQNVKFFYDLLKSLGHEPYFLIAGEPASPVVTMFGNEYRLVSHQSVLSSGRHIDIAFDAAASINSDFRHQLAERFGTRIVVIRYGISMVMDMEQMVHVETLTPGMHVGDADMLWTSPHIAYGASYLQTLYNCPAVSAPYLWEPDFIHGAEPTGTPGVVPDIYVMEPNLSVIKNALIPLAIIEEVYRRAPESFGKATILNGLGFNSRKFFLENIVRNLPCVRAEKNKVYFAGRHGFSDTFKRRGDVLLGHQWGCELNYLYLEALYLGVPLVHNAKALSKVGYYYPEFDAQLGRDRCLEALRLGCTEADLARNRKSLKKYSIRHPAVRRAYAHLLDQVRSFS